MLPGTAFDTILKYRDPGYSSVYSFSEEDAKVLLEQESSVGMARFEVGADQLIMDIDTGEEGLEAVGSALAKQGILFHVWESGNKGYHVYVPHDPIVDKRLPASHKALAKKLLGAALDKIDLTLYQPGRLISLPGRIHPVTRRKKTHLFTSPGEKLTNFDLVEEEPKVISNFSMSEPGSLHGALFRLAELAQIAPEAGTRHVRMWSVAKSLRDAGMDFETTLNLVMKVNESWDTPKSQKDVEQAVRGAYQ